MGIPHETRLCGLELFNIHGIRYLCYARRAGIQEKSLDFVQDRSMRLNSLDSLLMNTCNYLITSTINRALIGRFVVIPLW